MTPAERVLRARLGGYAARAKHDGVKLTAAARATFATSFRAGHACRVCPLVEMPSGLPEAEVVRRADALRRAHYTRLALRSARSRRNREAA
jgi:hypothetical protein